MIRLGLLLLLSSSLYAAESTVGFDSAATVYQAAAVYADDQSAALSQEQLAAVETSATHGFRIDVFEPAAIAALAADLDTATVKSSLDFLHSDAGQRMVAADVALAETDEATFDKIASGELAAPSGTERNAILDKIAIATHTVDSAVQIYLTIARALAIGTAIGSGLDPIAADQRVSKNEDAALRADLAQRMQAPLRRSLAYGYRTLSTADLRILLAFLDTKAGKKYTAATMAAMNAGFDAMGRRCGERIGERWREMALAQRAQTTRTAPTPPDLP
jgi:hypothetical protein